MGELEVARAQLVDCVIKEGGGVETHLHCVGDGAQWIAITVRDRLGGKATFLIDFYHLCEYLAPAAAVIAGKQKDEWFSQQKERMKNNQVRDVLKELVAHCQNCKVEQERRKTKTGSPDAAECPVEACKRYIENRINYFDYKSGVTTESPESPGLL